MFSKLMDSKKGRLVVRKHTICEVHRKIYDILVIELATTRPDVLKRIVPLLEEAFILGTRMNKKMAENKLNMLLTWPDHNYEDAIELRTERVRLIQMIRKNNQTLKDHEESK